jgi:ribosomal protein S18 acetylase RimI-like enzyme
VRGLEKRIEEMSLNAWPSLQTVVYDGWLLRFGEGYTKRANSIIPLYVSEKTFGDKALKCEKLYNSKGLNTIFKLADRICPDSLDKFLADRGYTAEAPTSVQLLELKGYEGKEYGSLLIRDKLEDEWLQNMQRISGTKTDSSIEIEKRILGNIVVDRYFVELHQQGEAVACGLGVIEDGYLGIFDIVVARQHRGKGFGRIMMESLLNLGKSEGADWAYLQVVLDNSVAINLYESLGFREIYKYWYRVKKIQA